MGLPFWLVWGVYGSTYAAANLIELANRRMSVSPTNASVGKLVGTTAVNMSASLVKDVAFAKMFGAKQTGAVFPICAERHCAAGALDYSVCQGSFRAAPGDCAGNDKDDYEGYDLHACAAACLKDDACAGFSILGTHCITKTESCSTGSREPQSSSWTFWVNMDTACRYRENLQWLGISGTCSSAIG